MEDEFHVAVRYTPSVSDERGLTCDFCYDETTRLSESWRRYGACRGGFPGSEAHEQFSFFNRRTAEGFLEEISELSYVEKAFILTEEELNQRYDALR